MKGMIKKGAHVSIDFHHYSWPLKNVDPKMVFQIKEFPDFIECKADGYGGSGNYGNGSIFVYEPQKIIVVEGKRICIDCKKEYEVFKTVKGRFSKRCKECASRNTHDIDWVCGYRLTRARHSF